jgi:hypothetical protein
MTYTKPQVTVIGDASELIASPFAKNTVSLDNHIAGTPAYDLDE